MDILRLIEIVVRPGRLLEAFERIGGNGLGSCGQGRSWLAHGWEVVGEGSTKAHAGQSFKSVAFKFET